jgi:hypothetical protein
MLLEQGVHSMQTTMQHLHIMEAVMEAINHLIQMRTVTRIATVVAYH